MPGTYQVGTTLRVEFGYCSPHFLIPESASSIRLATPWIGILNHADATVEAMLPLLEAIAASGRPVALFCADIPDELRDTLIVNHTHNTLRVVAIDAPSIAEYDRAQLFAIAAATGARIIGSNQILARTTLDMLGLADSVTVDAISTTLSGFPLLRE